MKKITQNLHSILMAFAAILFLSSCGGDDELVIARPTVDVTATIGGTTVNSGDEMTVGSRISFTVDITAAGGVNGLTVNGVSYSRTDLQAEAGDIEASIILNTDLIAIGTGEFVFQAVDDAGQVSEEVTFVVNVTGVPVNTYETVLLGAQGNANEGFYNAIENIRYTYAQARDASTVTSSPVDFAYYWGANDNSTLASIDDSGLHNVYNSVSLPIDGIFGTKNATRFVSTALTVAEFDAITYNNELQDAAFFETGGTSSSTNLAIDDVVAFQLDDARGGGFGLIKITSVDDTNGNGTITIVVKVGGE